MISKNYKITTADFKSLEDDLKLNIQLDSTQNSQDLLSFLITKAHINHYRELIPNANDIFIKTIQNNGL